MVIESGNLSASPSASHSAKLSLSDSVELSTLQQQRQTLLISAAVWLFAACCQSLSQTQQLIFLCTAAMADVETGKRGRQTHTVQRSSINQRRFALRAESQGCAKAVWGYNPGRNFKKVLIWNCIMLQENTQRQKQRGWASLNLNKLPSMPSVMRLH